MPGVRSPQLLAEVVARTDTAAVVPAREGLRVLDVLAALLDVTSEGHGGDGRTERGRGGGGSPS
jgi:hypothetical protein